eukprot:gnl/MRDRNA2_/MRDRNA2_113384_c0_seq1.p1 gnl/MRDRNA2_/MRDRNA2_113384_c0~~gnl/MRDRNA2_/MRDRNA2_113384_c0_seq1.p1  ORF type:complete len:411 (-),score=62.80 gnl/MRDRNA2_/MRDRNA2_113384_c0_seq1:65-1297(-)
MSALHLCLALVSIAVASSFHNQDSDAANADWLKIAAWITSNGGYVSPSIRGNMTSHSGVSIRGIVTDEDLRPGKPVLSIPKKLWFTLDNFPDIHQSRLEGIQQCNAPLQERHLNMVKMAGALAREKRKGNASFYQVYVSGLPTMEDFHSFHPRFMRDEVREDFRGLPLTSSIKELQLFDGHLKDCFQSWTEMASSPVSGITVDEMELALTQYRTRTFDSGAHPSMVPGADFFNTDKPILVNTIWKAQDDNFSVDMVKDGLPQTELFYMYCKSCDNDHLMGIWGLYLEGNENPLRTTADCAAQVDTLRHGSFKSLREASMAMLDLSNVAAAKESENRVPRCRKEAMSSQQGPLRCSLARLAWEYCAEEWGYPAGKSARAPGDPQPRVPGMAELLSQKYMNAFLRTNIHRHL